MNKLFVKYLNLLVVILLVSCEQTVYTGPIEEQSVPKRTAFIQSRPSHALIYLNGKYLGIQTPDSVNWLSSEDNLITLKLPLYSDTTFYANVNAGQIKNIFIDFLSNTKNVGNIYCSSDPTFSDIWLNDSLTNKKTPFTLSRLTPGNYEVKISSSQYRSDSINVNVYAGTTSNAFLSLEDTSKWVSYNKTNSGIISNYIISLICDKMNHIWIGTEKGLMSFDGKKFKSYTKQNSPLPSETITSLAVDNQNRKWIGTATGLMIYDNNSWIDFSSNLPDLYVTAITFDNLGNAWIGTPKGLVKYSNGNWKSFTTSNSGLRENFVTCIAVDKQNNIWVGSVLSGISVYDGNFWSYFDTQNLKLQFQCLDYVQSIAIDNQGIVWVSAACVSSSTTSVLCYNGKIWTRFMYYNNYTYSIFARDQFVVLCNKENIGILNNNNGFYHPYNKANKELTLYRVQAITMDNFNNIWLGTTDYGVGKFKAGNF